MATPVELRDGDRALAVVHPELGGWLTRYARQVSGHGLVDVLHHDDAVISRWPQNMWAGNPILFPHVSYNIHDGAEGKYALDGRVFASPQHGFGRRVPWAVAARDAASVTLELTDGERTRPSYPFAFRHRLTCRLEAGRLVLEQEIENRDARPLPFSTGIHPYLRVPLAPGGERGRCFVRLPAATRFVPVDQAASFTREAWAARELSVAEDVSGTIFLGELARPEIALVDPAAGLATTLNWAGAPDHRFVALWARTTAEPYYCVEPWTALPNSFGRADGGRITLPPGGRWTARLGLDVAACG
jgi:galactose mutarotase-like enzyme